MLRVGLTGGLASGKSLVGRTLAELGCLWIQADALGHAVLMTDGEAYGLVVEEFGDGILNADGTINRGKLAGEVFSKSRNGYHIETYQTCIAQYRRYSLAILKLGRRPEGH